MAEPTDADLQPVRTARTNEQIVADVRRRLRRLQGVDAGRIDVTVQNGEVTLEGTVLTRREARLTEAAAGEVPGGSAVRNLLRAAPGAVVRPGEHGVAGGVAASPADTAGTLGAVGGASSTAPAGAAPADGGRHG